MTLCESPRSILPFTPEALESDAHFSQLVQPFGSLRHVATGRRASFAPVCNESGARSGVWHGSNGLHDLG
eukprot:CAMPEP_0184659234 /NCGR_PEP_ID=MMETSP0308-20130426/28935_1 /TAXON_ID=38269 /ORGANISM="Gloeochaete witrockiana, Strain SAG 46.84" /LENGTH=69 /DNA_ID=CAMNT_0027098917 /DNA_START=332 /DNA_END=541 /DNA_ORIENTATION=-